MTRFQKPRFSMMAKKCGGEEHSWTASRTHVDFAVRRQCRRQYFRYTLMCLFLAKLRVFNQSP